MNKSVGIIMGSASDLPVMESAQKVLRELGVSYEMTVVSAHRTPDRMVEYARGAAERGIGVIIAGAGVQRTFQDDSFFDGPAGRLGCPSKAGTASTGGTRS